MNVPESNARDDAMVLPVAALCRPAEPGAPAEEVVGSDGFRRVRRKLEDGTEVQTDSFPDHPGASCSFFRLAHGPARSVRFVFDGSDDAVRCSAGGWRLDPGDAAASAVPTYWLPQPAVCRRLDAHGRILWQDERPIERFDDDGRHLAADLAVDADAHLDLTVWRFAPGDAAPNAVDLRDALAAPLALERQRWFLRSSHATIDRIGDLYRCLVHGWVYDNRFARRPRWPDRTWRICSENEAHSLYMLCNGLERATGRTLYTLLKRQIVASLIARQAPDGGWHHGEWTDLMESHFRLHSAGVLVLEAAFEETADPVVGRALEAAAAFLGGRTDRTDVGLWFLHDALEESVERATAEGAPAWEPTHSLGASPANKLILNSHLDAIVTLDRYGALTGDTRHAAAVDSARATTRTLLNARPAEWLYRPVYAAVWLTLLPAARSARLSPPLRLVRRLAQKHLVQNLYRLKRRFPRFVMPGGLIDRHLSPKHYNTGYHTVNLMDVVRLMRRFPDDGDLRRIARDAADATTRTGLLQHWVETRRIQPIGYWVEAIYQLCTLDPAPEYRVSLAEAMLAADDVGIGLPPTLLGADPEVIPQAQQRACPSPVDVRLRVAKLGNASRVELVLANPTREPLLVDCTGFAPAGLQWRSAEGSRPAGLDTYAPYVSARGWLVGTTVVKSAVTAV